MIILNLIYNDHTKLSTGLLSDFWGVKYEANICFIRGTPAN